MKALELILVLGFTWQVSDATVFADQKACLAGNGFVGDIPNMEVLHAIGDPENVDKLKDVSNDKIAAVIACIYKKQYGEKNLNDAIKSFVYRDEKIELEDKETVEEVLNTCNANAAGDNTKLLSCLNVLQAPFDRFAALIRDIPEALHDCFANCDLKVGEIYKLEENKKTEAGMLKVLSKDKLTCFVTCAMAHSQKNTLNKNS